MVDAYAYGWVHEWLDLHIEIRWGVVCIISRVLRNENEAKMKLGMDWNERLLESLAVGFMELSE
jgi:hypothetical protein